MVVFWENHPAAKEQSVDKHSWTNFKTLAEFLKNGGRVANAKDDIL